MVVGEIAESIDFLVIGGGPGGYVAALRAAQLGRQVVLVDKTGTLGLGGVCVNVGCIPSKALIETARRVWDARHQTDHGVRSQGVDVDLEEFQVWRRSIVSGLSGGIDSLLTAAGVAVMEGTARFTRPNTVAVESSHGTVSHLQFQDCVIAVGSRPVVLPGLARDGVRVLDSSDALGLESLPNEVVVVGGGYIGIELGTALAQLGSTVTIVEMSQRLLASVEADVAKPVLRRLRELGVTVLTQTQVIEDTGDSVIIRAVDGTTESKLSCDVVIVAVGRVPNTDDIGLDLAKITPDERGLLAVSQDRRLNHHVAAIGDITAGPALAHKAMLEGRIAAEALSNVPTEFAPLAIPAVVFSDPEIAVTGLDLDHARSLGHDAKAAIFRLSGSGRVATLGRSDGFVRLVTETSSGVILGAQLVGSHVSELVGEMTLAIEMGATAEDLTLTIHPHPTVSESLVDASLSALGTPIHSVMKRTDTVNSH